jgi:phosphoglycerol transferase MdoB-like AlkP superfamily enzyme
MNFDFLKKYAVFYNLGLFYILCNFIIRILLIFNPITQTSFEYTTIIKIFAFGFLSDLLVFIILSSFLWLYLVFISNSKYYNPYGYILFVLFVSLLLYVSFSNTILNEYGGALPEIGIAFIAIKTTLFGLLLFLPNYRDKIRIWLFSFVIFIYVIAILQNSISEYLFWNEFGVRYNFIAVDYLVYTNEVIGNIVQSYPVIPIYTVLVSIAIFFTYFIVKKSKIFLSTIPTLIEKAFFTASYFVLFGISIFLIPIISSKENSSNIFASELQSNGMNKFYKAFMNSELDYFKFYKTIPNKEALAILEQQIPTIKGSNFLQNIVANSTEKRKNVVLITIESYSAEFLKKYGNEQNITPFLDSLADKSLLFSNLYAVGNRTVRGLEAVTLCLPPTPGESVVKRKDNKDKFSTGSIFKSKGYTVKYIYGGDAYFDNMQDFFTGNGYGIVDKKSFSANEITFSNVWGVCDEDLYKKAIQTMNQENLLKKPFFNHIMTTSNHRPFTYPEGKIDISGKAKSREGGVKYTDYALREFFKMAKKQTWFQNTVFVILADHCASSSGKTELPMDKYRIPAMIYSPSFIKPAIYPELMSQIDIMPTLFGLLDFSYQSKFFGQDVLKSNYKPRALIATYQNLGLIKDDYLTILSPKQEVKQFQLQELLNPKLGKDFQLFFEEIQVKSAKNNLVLETISYYQTASELLNKKKYQAKDEF